MERFEQQLKEKGLAAATIARKLAAIKAFYRFMTAEGYMDANPAEVVEAGTKGIKLPRVLSEDEVVRLLNQPDITTEEGFRDRTMLEVLYATGMRVSELINLTLERVDLNMKYIIAFGKGSKERIVPLGSVAAEFLQQYYAQRTVPPQVTLDGEVEGKEALRQWLSEKAGRSVKLTVPQKGEQLGLCEMCKKNARERLVMLSGKSGRQKAVLDELAKLCGLEKTPEYIESYDISHTAGQDMVASMVVFTGGKPDKNQYRRFKIKTPLDEANDFLSMQEVLGRRYSPERMADERFGSRPDLLVVDGGKPQLTAAIKQLEALGLDIPVCGLAKADEEVFVPWDETPVVLPTGSASLYLIKQVRDESHRFAITFHRELRDKAMTVSVLDDVPGVGPTRKRAIMRHFGSMKRLRAASEQEIAKVRGIPADVAKAVHEALVAWNAERAEAAAGHSDS